MKALCVLACWLTVAYGGVVPWTQSGEEYAINLYKQYCGYGDKGVNGDIHWYCKNGPQGSDEYFEHHKNLKSQTQTQKQVIFINMPGKKIRHKVRVDGSAGVQQDTNIYVLPPKITHEVDITGDIKTHSEPSKPHTFFLKKNPSGGGGGHYPAPHYPPSPSKYPGYDLPTFVAPEEPHGDYGYGGSRRHRKRSSRRSSSRQEQVQQQEAPETQPIWEDFMHQQDYSQINSDPQPAQFAPA